MTQLTPTLYTVEVPDEAKDFEVIEGNSKINPILRWYNSGLIKLPIGNWQILGTVTPDAIDFDCSFMVGDNEMIMDSLMHMEDIYDIRFRSLLTSKGCDLTKKHVIIKSKI